MIKATINKGNAEMQVTGRFQDICAEYILMGRLIAESFAEKDKNLAKIFEDGIKKMAEDHVFSCDSKELDEKTESEEEEKDGLSELMSSLDELQKALEGLKNATK